MTLDFESDPPCVGHHTTRLTLGVLIVSGFCFRHETVILGRTKNRNRARVRVPPPETVTPVLARSLYITSPRPPTGVQQHYRGSGDSRCTARFSPLGDGCRETEVTEPCQNRIVSAQSVGADDSTRHHQKQAVPESLVHSSPPHQSSSRCHSTVSVNSTRTRPPPT